MEKPNWYDYIKAALAVQGNLLFLALFTILLLVYGWVEGSSMALNLSIFTGIAGYLALWSQYNVTDRIKTKAVVIAARRKQPEA
ncbi:hypothetical protein [Aeromonas veronii]|uniref:Holin n=1 Tax=Aeromonas veronii TaxID=654 RepID=A0A4S5CK71_AERVE|nr:hypothetical protein [Aeromonas veronii]THJ45051.1 hypothetical protein E8Q35_12770 [Aeromonas veronii]